MDTVALMKSENGVNIALENGIELLGGFGAFESPFIIKPNICTISDKVGFAVSDVKLVEALIDLILRDYSNLKVRIVESDSESKFADEAFRKFGYKKIEEKYAELGSDVSLVNLSHSPTSPVELDGLYFRNPEIPELVVGSKYFVSVAVAKTHGLTFITGTLKNLFGLLPRKDQSFYHRYINEVIVDLNRLVKPDLCVVDARVGLEGWAGPRTRHLDMIVLGRNPVSADATMARIMGFNPEKIRHLVEAEKYGLGSLHPEVLGVSIDSAVVEFNSPSNLSSSAVL